MVDVKRQQCKLIIQSDNKHFFRKRNVVGMAFGSKIINGYNTNEYCLKVFVAKKESNSELNANDLIPKFHKGVKTDVIQTGKLTFSVLNQKKPPIKGGISIGPSGVNITGTGGCLVKDRCGNYYVLSNNHVLSNSDEFPIGHPILCPGAFDGGKFPDDVIGHLSKKVPLIDSTDEVEVYNYIDCAIAKLVNPCLFSKQIAFIGGVKGVSSPKLNMRIKKVGRTTELTTGIITELDALIEIITKTGANRLFDNQIVSTCMNDSGDSGSLVLDECNNVIGLLYAKGDSVTMINPIKDVLKALDVSIVMS